MLSKNESRNAAALQHSDGLANVGVTRMIIHGLVALEVDGCRVWSVACAFLRWHVHCNARISFNPTDKAVMSLFKAIPVVGM